MLGLLGLLGLVAVRLGLSPLGLVWLGRLASRHDLNFEQKIP